MKIKKRYIALGAFCVLIGALYYDLSTPPETEVEGHFLVVMDGEPFLIPKAYHYGYATHDGRTNAVVLSAGLPDLTPNAAELAATAPIRRSGNKEWRIASPHKLSGYAQLPYQIDVVPGRSAIERYILNGLSYGDRNPNLSNEEQKPEVVLNKWRAFVEKNNHRDGELINANEVLNTWSDVNPSITYVVFSKGLVVLWAKCDKPAEGMTPGCWTDYHKPNTKYIFRMTYDLRYLDQTYDIAKKSAALIKQWNVNAHEYLKAKKEQVP